MIRSIFTRAVRLALAGAATLTLALPAMADAATDREQQIRTAMVFNFARFATWENRKPDTPITLCVSQDADIGERLVALQGRKLGSTVIETRWLSNAKPGECAMAYLAGADADPDTARALQRDGVMTVSSDEAFAQNGVIGLVRIGRQTRFEVNTSAAREAGVTLSSKLLRIASEVN